MSMRPALQRVAKDRTFAAKVVTEEKRNCRKRRRDTLDGCVRTFHNSSRGAPSESSQQPASAARPNKSRTWSCARCTLDNGNRRKFCELCKWPRGQPFDESDACHDGDVRPRSCSNVLAAMQATSGESLGRSATDFAWPTEARHAVLQNPTRMSEVIEVQDNEARQKSLRVVPPQSIVDSDGGEAAEVRSVEIWRSTASYRGRRPLSLISASPTPMRRRTGINLHGRSLRKLQSARRISTWRPAESVGGISSPWLILWTVWPERRQGLLRSSSRRSLPAANGTIPTARWRVLSRL